MAPDLFEAVEVLEGGWLEVVMKFINRLVVEYQHLMLLRYTGIKSFYKALLY